jgi:hypothetical protein
VPEASINKYSQLPFWKVQVWPSWNFGMQPVTTDSLRPDVLSEKRFALCVLVLNLRHIEAPLLFRVYVHENINTLQQTQTWWGRKNKKRSGTEKRGRKVMSDNVSGYAKYGHGKICCGAAYHGQIWVS